MAPVGDRGQQLVQGLGGGRRKPVEDEAVSTGLRPLSDQGIEPPVSRCLRFLEGGHAGHYGDTGAFDAGQFNRARKSEGE